MATAYQAYMGPERKKKKKKRKNDGSYNYAQQQSDDDLRRRAPQALMDAFQSGNLKLFAGGGLVNKSKIMHGYKKGGQV